MTMNRNTVLTVWLVVLLSAGLALLPGIPSQKQEKQAQEFTLVAVGDCIISNKISFFDDPSFLNLVSILRKADCTVGNCETTFFKPEDGFAAYKEFDPNVFCYPWGADEIKWLGIDLMGLANNHIMDFDYDGMFSTMNHLERVGITYAGAGKDLARASRPGYYETAKGPVALISCSSWLPEKNHQASQAHPYMKGKPGLNPLNVTYKIQLDKENFARAKELRDNIFKGLLLPTPKEEPGKETTEIDLELTKFTKGVKVEYLLVPDPRDLERIRAAVQVAKRNARLVIVSLHEHFGLFHEKAPTKYQEDFARSVIDAGADVFVSTGPHELFGIEMYKGKPIFHSIGNFLFQGPLRIIAPEAYERMQLPAQTTDPTLYEEKFFQLFSAENIPIWESVVPSITFDAENRIKEIRLHAITLDEKAPWFRRGTPRLADMDHAEAIIQRLNKLSARYQTRIVFEKGTGKIIL